MKKIKEIFKFIWKYNRAWMLTTIIVLAFFFTVSIVATQNDFLAGTLDTVLGGETRKHISGDPEQYNRYPKTTNFNQFETDLELSAGINSTNRDKRNSLEMGNLLNEVIAEEGFVLLKNDNKALPIATNASKKAKISVFGKNSANIVLGGSGSGGGNEKDAVNLYESLEKANFELNPELKSFYQSSKSGKGRDANPAIGVLTTGLEIGETPQDRYTDSIKNSFGDYSDAAIIVFSRIGGEGFDLPRLQQKTYGGAPISGSKEGGQHYLELDQNELDLIDMVVNSNKFDRVVVLINASTSMELGIIQDNPKIDSILWIGSPGGSGALAIGRVLNGTVNPSGRLVDTFTRDFSKDPTWNNFGDNMLENGNAYLTGGANSGYYFVEYQEGIYYGYRYYETASYENVIRFGSDYGWYDEHVVYPFGYGLSYTNFKWELVNEGTTLNGSVLINGDQEITVKVKVTNQGEVAGKEVVQLYYSAPYIQNGIEKAHVVLGAFEKTDIIQPGQSEIVTLKLKVSDMASYDYDDANGNGFKGYELDPGLYEIYVGQNVHNSWNITSNNWVGSANSIVLEYSLLEGLQFEYDVDEKALSNDNQFDDMSTYMKDKVMSRASFAITFPKKLTKEERELTPELLDSLTFKYDDVNASYKNKFTGVLPTQGKVGDPVQLYELIGKDIDDPMWDDLLDHLTIDEMVILIGQGNFHTESIDRINKPRTIDPDGPAGFTNFMGDPTVHETTFFASETVIGSTWNKDLAHDMGVVVGLQGIVGYTKGDGRPYSGWYAPAVNIHRSPFSGRNWEYYSEDPYLSGMMGAFVVQGAKSKGVYTYVKHFVLNDQETSRDANGLVTWADEQTFREIYLRPFQIIVEKGETNAMMSSFNRIGTVWAGGSYELLENVLRKEWGFVGMVISDYNLGNAYMPPDQMIRAGGDLNLTQDYKPSPKANKEGMNDTTQVEALRQASKNILYVVANSNAMNGMGEGVVWGYKMATWKVLLIVVNVALVLGFGIWGFFSIRKSKKEHWSK
ncbi:MAG: glycoside hydrolase family 3 C-terminal domain-containing protein [Acholeplasmataceae bacterium]|jgi:beta-glucosidase